MSSELLSIDEFGRAQFRVGQILSASPHPDPKVTRLLVLSVDVGEETPRQIVAGIAGRFKDPTELVGRKIIVVINLPPAKLRGVESTGMLLAAGGDSGVIDLVTVDAPPGTVVR